MQGFILVINNFNNKKKGKKQRNQREKSRITLAQHKKSNCVKNN